MSSPSAYGQPQYGVPQSSARTNGLAIAALIGGIVFAPLGIVLGHIALRQIGRTGEGGRGLALAGLIIGYAITLMAIVTILMMALLVSGAGSG
ncbi:DUF4190 domain-containing protein [Tsukamurella ocularis]|uniref:DUF4190 domain-containing protein n=1 Tax=Tsukamurella ocularis TaxID=1970234 RepID=UPI0039EF3921